MSALFERISVFGMGLLGGSVSVAARARGIAGEVVGVTRREENARAVEAAGLVDRAVIDSRSGVRGADLVVLCNPVFAMPETLERCASALEPGAIVTDVGSVKGPLAESLPGLLPDHAVYVGSHPMAGSHETGFAHARADLFEDAACVVTRSAGNSDADVARVSAFWSALGGRVFERDPTLHDDEVAWISHAPHAIAYAFAHALAASPGPASELRGAGFRDFTRIAGADAEMWTDILMSNRKALAGPLQAMAHSLEDLARAIAAGESERVLEVLVSAREVLAAGAEKPAVKAAATTE
jgi:prephenate dehydrogenase